MTSSTPHLPPPSASSLLHPLVAALPTAAVSPTPPPSLLPLLSPILRQRVQLLSSTASPNEPWLPLLSYTSSASDLSKVVTGLKFEAHPVSGEIEIDWDDNGEVEIKFRRIDDETLHARIALHELGVGIRCVWCVGDTEGSAAGIGAEGWRIGEVAVLEHLRKADESEGRDWEASIPDAEGRFAAAKREVRELGSDGYIRVSAPEGASPKQEEEEEDDDDAYWAQYDNTPARTPATKRSPAPGEGRAFPGTIEEGNDEDNYFSQYADVQPAMDGHDPDEAAHNGDIESTLGPGANGNGNTNISNLLNGLHSQTHESNASTNTNATDGEPSHWHHTNGHAHNEHIEHPRPARSSSTSSSSSSRSIVVARLEDSVQEHEMGQSELAIRQHISTSMKSLYRLARVAGVDRAEFERVVRRELDVLGMLDEE
jgi:hypothetical protein